MTIELDTAQPDPEQREAFHRKLFDEFLHSDEYDPYTKEYEHQFSMFLSNKLYTEAK